MIEVEKMYAPIYTPRKEAKEVERKKNLDLECMICEELARYKTTQEINKKNEKTFNQGLEVTKLKCEFERLKHEKFEGTTISSFSNNNYASNSIHNFESI